MLASLAGTTAPSDLASSALASLGPERARQLYPDPLVSAAVLVPLVEQGGGLEVMLTVRSAGLRDHPGQISFPGGRMERGEDDPARTALRELEEETGIGSEFVELAGYLPANTVITGFAVSPVVGFLRPGYLLRPDPREVTAVFTVPLGWLRNPLNLKRSVRQFRGFELPLHEFTWEEHRIWGATANILLDLCRLLDD
ncbi:MAG: CoA pyrophosphatase [Chromatiales bacterium]|nr:CoA pyrophosphatase [Chromatiales bacterium]